MNKRQKKKHSKRQQEENPVCPICSGSDGVYAVIIKGSRIHRKFMWCSTCDYEYKLQEQK
jgi:formate dehydrogenase maturation protein FdhE